MESVTVSDCSDAIPSIISVKLVTILNRATNGQDDIDIESLSHKQTLEKIKTLSICQTELTKADHLTKKFRSSHVMFFCRFGDWNQSYDFGRMNVRF